MAIVPRTNNGHATSHDQGNTALAKRGGSGHPRPAYPQMTPDQAIALYRSEKARRVQKHVEIAA